MMAPVYPTALAVVDPTPGIRPGDVAETPPETPPRNEPETTPEPLLGNIANFVGSALPGNPHEAAFRKASEPAPAAATSPDSEDSSMYSTLRNRDWVRGRLQVVTADKRLQICGVHSIRPQGSVDIRKVEDSVSVVGLASCAHWYSCPFCAAKISRVRAGEIRAAVAQAVALRWAVAMLTVTVRHRVTDSLETLVEGLGSCWRKGVGQDKAFRQIRTQIGWIGYIRAFEVTYGRNGWHPHFHFLVFLDPSQAAGGTWSHDQLTGETRPTDDAIKALEAVILRAWVARAKREGLRVPNEHGVDLRLLANPEGEVADYVTKATAGVMGDETFVRVHCIAGEMTSAATKVSRGHGLTQWELLVAAAETVEAFVATGEVSRYLELFWELESTLKGKAMIRWSRGLRDLLQVEDVSDEEIVAEGADPVEATLRGVTKRGVGSARGRWMAVRESAARAEVGDDLARDLDAMGIENLPPDHPILVSDRAVTGYVTRQTHAQAVAMRVHLQETWSGDSRATEDNNENERKTA